VERIREGWPQATFSVLAPSKLADLWRMQSFVNQVIEMTRDDSVLALSRRLRAEDFDAAIILPNSPRTALEAWLAGIPFRAGYGGGGRGLLLSACVPRRKNVVSMRKKSIGEIRRLVKGGVNLEHPIPVASHHVAHYLHLVESLGFDGRLSAPSLEVPAEEVEKFRSKFLQEDQRNRLDKGGRLIGLNPGAEYGPAKRWSHRRMVESVMTVGENQESLYAVFGVGSDEVAKETAELISLQAGRERVVNLVGNTSLGELLCGLSLCSVLLTNDSGPMHVAGALGTPLVVPFGSTSVELTGPGMPGMPPKGIVRSNVPCSPCFLRECPIDFRCMETIEVEVVVEALQQALKTVN